DHVDKKGRFSYLKWQKAYEFLNENFPNNSFEFKTFKTPDGRVLDYMQYPDGTGSVHCEITIKDGEETVSKAMYLPILNHSNNPIKNPNSMAVNTAKQRCFVKCLAMMGLGMHIYLGAEDDPVYDDTRVKIEEIPQEEGQGDAPSRAVTKVPADPLADLRKVIKQNALDQEKIDDFFMSSKGVGLFSYVGEDPGSRLQPAIEFVTNMANKFK
ncbi:MAG: DUF1071 domain-containing protein, partial [Actinomycetota bacterium]|nr:DUF1071 domain-containing protein [Actinomycetota bacterium]